MTNFQQEVGGSVGLSCAIASRVSLLCPERGLPGFVVRVPIAVSSPVYNRSFCAKTVFYSKELKAFTVSLWNITGL
jgi:hypothetical protein